MLRTLKLVLAVCAIFACAAIGFMAVEFAVLARDVRQNVAAVSRHVDASLTDLDRAVRIAGGAINEARTIERDNRADIKAVNRESLATLRDMDALVRHFDVTQQAAGQSIQEMSAALVPVMRQSEQDLRELQPAIQQTAPLLEQATAIAMNLNASTADVEHEIHKLVYPPPRKWYQKYFLDPLRVAAHLVTIPLR